MNNKNSPIIKSVMSFSYNGKIVDINIPGEDLFKIADIINNFLNSKGIKSELEFRDAESTRPTINSK